MRNKIEIVILIRVKVESGDRESSLRIFRGVRADGARDAIELAASEEGAADDEVLVIREEEVMQFIDGEESFNFLIIREEGYGAFTEPFLVVRAFKEELVIDRLKFQSNGEELFNFIIRDERYFYN
ncbi:MAG: hypothetical protein QXS37_05610 [Candidatus Aenigmatarchaeota archaeon]